MLSCAMVEAIALDGLYFSLGEIFHVQSMEPPPIAQAILMITAALFIVAIVCVLV